MFQIFENRISLFQYFFLWIIYAILHIFSMWWLTNISVGTLIIDGTVHAIIFAIIGVLIGNIIQYVNYSILPGYLYIPNSIFLVIISVCLWVGIGYFIVYIVTGESIALQFISTLPVRSLIGILLCLTLIMYFRLKMLNQEKRQPSEEPIVDVVTKTIASPTEILDRVAIKTGNKIDVVFVSDIIYFQADGDYVQIFTSGEKYLKEQTMKYFEEHLSPQQFVRVHRSFIVNINAILRVETLNKQNELILKNGDKLKISANGYKLLRATLSL